MIIIEADGKIFKISLMLFTGVTDQLFRRNAFCLSTQHNWRAVGIIRADIVALMTLHFLKTYPYVSLNIFDEMPQMD